MKKIFIAILAVLTKLIINKYKPLIIGITGSVGKTSAKEAITVLLQQKYRVRKSYASFNNEFGIPFTVIGQEEYLGKNPIGWMMLFLKAVGLLIGGEYPQVLVLELGADRPGNIAYLLKLIGQIDYAVVTNVGISHLMNYSSTDALAKEKMSLLEGLKSHGCAVLNVDVPAIADRVQKLKTEIITYGINSDAVVNASEINLIRNGQEYGLNFKINHKGNSVPFFLPNTLGQSNVYAALAAVCIGLRMQMNLVEISEALRNYISPKGRLKVIAGIKNARIIDDTYNAAPASTILALDVLNELGGSRKVLALGHMAELGSQTEVGHRQVAAKIQEINASLVFLVGEQTKYIKDELEARHFSNKVLWFATSDVARIPVQNELKEGDTILVKGSQSARMEKIVKEIMAEPLRAQELLVRQTPQWLK